MKNENYIKDYQPYFYHLYEQLILANLYFEDLMYIAIAEEGSFNSALQDSPFLSRIQKALQAVFSLRIYSFLNEKESRNFPKLIGKLVKGHPRSDWKELISLGDLDHLQSEIHRLKDSTAFQTITHFRNKIYAHKDKNAFDTSLKSDMHSVQNFMEKLISLFQFLGGKLFNTHFSVKLNPWDVDHNLIRQLSVFFEVMELYKELKFTKDKKVITLDELEKCLLKYQ